MSSACQWTKTFVFVVAASYYFCDATLVYAAAVVVVIEEGKLFWLPGTGLNNKWNLVKVESIIERTAKS